MVGTGVESAIASLERVFEEIGPVAVAVSGGVDSMTLAVVAYRALGESATMIHAISATVRCRVRRDAVVVELDAAALDAPRRVELAGEVEERMATAGVSRALRFRAVPHGQRVSEARCSCRSEKWRRTALIRTVTSTGLGACFRPPGAAARGRPAPAVTSTGLGACFRSASAERS